MGFGAFSRLKNYETEEVRKFGAVLINHYNEESEVLGAIEIGGDWSSDVTKVFVLLENGMDVVMCQKSVIPIDHFRQSAAIDVYIDFIPYRRIARLKEYWQNTNALEENTIHSLTIYLDTEEEYNVLPSEGFMKKERGEDLTHFYRILKSKL